MRANRDLSVVPNDRDKLQKTCAGEAAASGSQILFIYLSKVDILIAYIIIPKKHVSLDFIQKYINNKLLKIKLNSKFDQKHTWYLIVVGIYVFAHSHNQTIIVKRYSNSRYTGPVQLVLSLTTARFYTMKLLKPYKNIEQLQVKLSKRMLAVRGRCELRNFLCK